MIDPQSGHRSRSDKIDNQLVRGVEHFGQFHPDCRQIIHIEKTAIINFLGRDAPKRQAIRLRVKKLIQPIEAPGIAWATVNFSQRFFNRALNLGCFLTTPLQTALHDFLFPRALGDLFRIGLSPSRQILQRSQNALKLGVKLFVFVFREIFQRHLEHETISAGRNRQFLISIGQREGALFEMHLQFAALQHATVLIAQDREQNFIAQVGFERAPIDVEIRRIH